ncbi:chloride channel protein [Vulcanisaeta souniana]|uniref:Chloride channel protein n=1 Tax=Vulcanisaeta souniana JCM 11219 TaxID=1293586 RepID=A0A830E2B0_9CREN|nr:chloride channel protein [Vulcanisaeta souniana]BDR92395.1 chloride channel protein [Vulcanisaeta souniana JCM 11219]GGI75231.1 chloride channel protein [Vulcanisaeta souniana JCM 11219]
MRIRELPYFVKWFILGTVIGVVAGLSALTFYFALKLMEYLFILKLVGYEIPEPLGEGGSLNYVFHAERIWLIPLSTALGGLLSGLIVYTWAPEAEGHGTDAAINAFHRLQGRIRRRIPPIKLIASAITIGSGGSAGREGPTAQLSAGIGSILADLFSLPPEDRRIAVAVGIGAGIGSIFKAPIGGAILAAEVLYKRDFESEVLFPALVASAIGYVIFSSVTGFTPIFGYYMGTFNPLRLPLYAVLGVIDGLMAILYVKTFYSVHDAFKRWRVSNYIKPVVGGAVTGLIGLLFPEVLGTGYGWLNLAEFNVANAFISPVIALPLLIILALLPFLKIVATSFSIGSGGSGGVYAPGLVIGAFTGFDAWLIFHYLVPGLAPDPAPFVIISMLALFGAAAKAPLAVMFMVVEMTGSYQLLPGAMIAVAIAYLISGDYTIYRAQVPTRRDSPAHADEYRVPLLMEIRVNECELIKEPIAHADEDVATALNRMLRYRYTALPVIDPEGRFMGVVSLYDMGRGRGRVRDYVRPMRYVTPESTLYDALGVMSEAGTTWAPVVNNGEFLGILTMEGMNRAYSERLRGLRANA